MWGTVKTSYFLMFTILQKSSYYSWTGTFSLYFPILLLTISSSQLKNYQIMISISTFPNNLWSKAHALIFLTTFTFKNRCPKTKKSNNSHCLYHWTFLALLKYVVCQKNSYWSRRNSISRFCSYNISSLCQRLISHLCLFLQNKSYYSFLGEPSPMFHKHGDMLDLH